MENRKKSKQSRTIPHCSSMGNMNVEIELLVQSTQSFSSVVWQRKSGSDRFHGWLWNKSGCFGRWKNQHFILDGVILSYYDAFAASQFATEASLAPLGSENMLTGVDDTVPSGVLRVAHVERSTRSRVAFKVYGLSGKILDLRAKNEQVCSQWVQRLSDAAMFGKRQQTLNNSTASTASTHSLGFTDLDVDSSINIVDKSGWLKVIYANQKNLNAQYCVAQGSLITFYNSEDPWAVPNLRAYVSALESNASSLELFLTTREGRNTSTITLRAGNSLDFDTWKDVLEHAIDL